MLRILLEVRHTFVLFDFPLGTGKYGTMRHVAGKTLSRNDQLTMKAAVFRGVKPGETNQPDQFQKTIRGMKSVPHNPSFLIFDTKIFSLSGVAQTCN